MTSDKGPLLARKGVCLGSPRSEAAVCIYDDVAPEWLGWEQIGGGQKRLVLVVNLLQGCVYL